MPDKERFRIQLQLKRGALRGVDVHDTAAVRAWAKAQVEGRVSLGGALPPRVRYLREGVVEVGDIDGVVELGQERRLAAAFKHAGDRTGVVRRLREGEVLLSDAGGGRARRAAAVLEVLPGDTADSWWLAWRYFGQGEAGVGIFHGPWREQEGVGLDALDAPFDEWLDEGETKITDQGAGEPGPQVSADFDLRMAVLNPPNRMPAHPAELAVGIGRSMDQEVLTRGLTCHIVFVITEDATERYELRGELPCELDDVIRNLAQLGVARGVTLVTPGTVSLPDGTTRRAVHTHAEVPGVPVRARRILPMEMGEDGRPAALPEVFQEVDLAQSDAWIGVAPDIELGLHPTGTVSGAGEGPVPEG